MWSFVIPVLYIVSMAWKSPSLSIIRTMKPLHFANSCRSPFTSDNVLNLVSPTELVKLSNTVFLSGVKLSSLVCENLLWSIELRDTFS